MHRKKSYPFSNKRELLLHCLVLLTCILLSFSAVSCSPDNTVPSSTFRVYMYDGNMEPFEPNAPDYYPQTYSIYMKMEDLPDNEKILYTGACYSTDDDKPDTSDYLYIFDDSDNPTIQGWDWDKDGPMIWNCLSLIHLTPGETYYIRGYVLTDKGEYYTDTMEVRSEYTTPLVEDPEAYEIPVVFHLFPDEHGYYPVKDWMADDMISYANHVYSNYFSEVPGQVRTGVRFVPATLDPEGNPLQTPGVVYEQEAVKIDYLDTQLDRKYIWDMEKVLNVWVCPIDNAQTDLAGFSSFPFFDSDECMEGCNIYKPGLFTGIFINSDNYTSWNIEYTFAHEAGHFLGLDHVFTEDYCNDTPWYDYDAFRAETNGMYVFERWNDKESWWSDNVMDYDPSFMTGFTPEQAKRIQYTLDHAYFIPGEAGKTAPEQRSIGFVARFGKPVQ